jgi:glycosyltransferase involved in cell wall biosynthesis
MNPLNVALVVKGSASNYDRNGRNMGWWSYPVPEFTWHHFYLGDPFRENRSRFRDYDLIFIEDGGNYGKFTGEGPPVAYHIIDSTLSQDHYRVRHEQAKRSDLVLVDHDRLERFVVPGKPVRRFGYCVNDRVFKPLEKSLDFTFYCGTGARKGMPGGVERTELRQYLDGAAKDGGYSFRSGVHPLPLYAENMGKSRVIVNWPRTAINRPHRVFDAMACGACLVTGILPVVSGDCIMPGLHYLDFEDKKELPMIFETVLKNEKWQEIAQKGYELVMLKHTWATRAKELRKMLNEEFGL